MIAGEWIAHDGTGMPVAGDVIVEVLLRRETPDDFQSDPRAASDWFWEDDGTSGVITHYKVVQND